MIEPVMDMPTIEQQRAAYQKEAAGADTSRSYAEAALHALWAKKIDIAIRNSPDQPEILGVITAAPLGSITEGMVESAREMLANSQLPVHERHIPDMLPVIELLQDRLKIKKLAQAVSAAEPVECKGNGLALV